MKHLFLLLLAGTACFAQEKETSCPWKSSFDFGTGVSEIQRENKQLLFGTDYHVNIVAEYQKNKNISIVSGLSAHRINYTNALGQNNTSAFMGIPLKIRLNIFPDKAISPFAELGIYANTLVFSNTYTVNKTVSKLFNEYTFGGTMSFGAFIQSDLYVKAYLNGDLLSTLKVNNERYLFSNSGISIGYQF